MSQEHSPATGESLLVSRLRALHSPYAKVGALRAFHNEAADEIERLQKLIQEVIDAGTSVPSETPRIKELHARLWDHIGNTFPSIDDPTRAVLHGYLDELADAAQSKIAAIGKICPTCEGHANPERTVSATPCSGWVSVLEKLPESYGDVLVAHPTYSQSSAEMYGLTIRPGSVVRLWMSDESDTSMHGAYWQHLPKGPA